MLPFRNEVQLSASFSEFSQMDPADKCNNENYKKLHHLIEREKNRRQNQAHQKKQSANNNQEVLEESKM